MTKQQILKILDAESTPINDKDNELIADAILELQLNNLLINRVLELPIHNVSNCYACGTKVDEVYCDVCACKGLESYDK